MSPIATGRVARAFALTQPRGFGFLSRENIRRELRSLVGTIAERLIAGQATRTVRVLLTLFQLDLFGFACGNFWFVHGFWLSLSVKGSQLLDRCVGAIPNSIPTCYLRSFDSKTSLTTTRSLDHNGTAYLMPNDQPIYQPGPRDRTVRDSKGKIIPVPKSWSLLKAGDAGATRRVKAAGLFWTVKAKRGRRTISLGVWADRKTIHAVQKQLAVERSTDAYKKKQASAAKRREKIQNEYIDEFTDAVFAFLNFDQRYRELAGDLAVAIARHATPVGSGTVARTKRIPIERRAEAAVIAWMRHQTTAYDNMTIPTVKGQRREVRRMLAKQSRLLLDVYRKGKTIDASRCLLRQGLQR